MNLPNGHKGVNSRVPEIVSISCPTCNSMRLLRSMKSKTSTGHDGFSSKLIKQLAPSISYPISIIINRSFETGVLGSDVLG